MLLSTARSHGCMAVRAPAGYEADDVIASLVDHLVARPGSCRSPTVIIVSTDSDMRQLMVPNVFWLEVAMQQRKRPALLQEAGTGSGMVLHSQESFIKEWGFPPVLWSQYTALVGKAEGGVPGIGLTKSQARRLLSRYCGLEQILMAVGQGECGNMKSEVRIAMEDAWRELCDMKRAESLPVSSASIPGQCLPDGNIETLSPAQQLLLPLLGQPTSGDPLNKAHGPPDIPGGQAPFCKGHVGVRPSGVKGKGGQASGSLPWTLQASSPVRPSSRLLRNYELTRCYKVPLPDDISETVGALGGARRSPQEAPCTELRSLGSTTELEDRLPPSQQAQKQCPQPPELAPVPSQASGPLLRPVTAHPPSSQSLSSSPARDTAGGKSPSDLILGELSGTPQQLQSTQSFPSGSARSLPPSSTAGTAAESVLASLQASWQLSAVQFPPTRQHLWSCSSYIGELCRLLVTSNMDYQAVFTTQEGLVVDVMVWGEGSQERENRALSTGGAGGKAQGAAPGRSEGAPEVNSVASKAGAKGQEPSYKVVMKKCYPNMVSHLMPSASMSPHKAPTSSQLDDEHQPIAVLGRGRGCPPGLLEDISSGDNTTNRERGLVQDSSLAPQQTSGDSAGGPWPVQFLEARQINHSISQANKSTTQQRKIVDLILQQLESSSQRGVAVFVLGPDDCPGFQRHVDLVSRSGRGVVTVPHTCLVGKG